MFICLFVDKFVCLFEVVLKRCNFGVLLCSLGLFSGVWYDLWWLLYDWWCENYFVGVDCELEKGEV